MSEFFAYERLKWPEVAALPRDTPLVIPLGEGYALERLAEALGGPARVGLLPAIPYGWANSGLEAPGATFGALAANLLSSLRDDGFSRVYALTPQGPPGAFGPELEQGGQRIAQPHRSHIAPGEPMPADSERGKVILIPIGHTEQHALHLPLNTDTVIIGNIGRESAASAPEEAGCLPVFPYGVSTHRSSFAGTLNCGGRAFEDFWLAILDVLVGRGFDRFYLMSGHGGNVSFLVNIVKYAGERHRRVFCATAYLHTAGHIAAPIVEATRRSGRGGMGHAGELETAMMLHLWPELVEMERAVDEVDFVATESYYMDWAEGGALIANPPWDDDTATGAYGAGSVATAENGKLWFEAAVREKVAHVAEIHEQQRRREARREAGIGHGLTGKAD